MSWVAAARSDASTLASAAGSPRTADTRRGSLTVFAGRRSPGDDREIRFLMEVEPIACPQLFLGCHFSADAGLVAVGVVEDELPHVVVPLDLDRIQPPLGDLGSF